MKLNLKKIVIAICSSIMVYTCSAQDVPLAEFEKSAIEVTQKFMDALNSNSSDISAAAAAAMPFIHKSEYDNSGAALKKDRMDFSFKKAWQNAKFYETPIKVTRIQKQALSGIGFGASAELGVSYKVFIAKKSGVAGMPAALHVFIPKDGGKPKIHYYGSL
jgi:hypothetical protein